MNTYDAEKQDAVLEHHTGNLMSIMQFVEKKRTQHKLSEKIIQEARDSISIHIAGLSTLVIFTPELKPALSSFLETLATYKHTLHKAPAQHVAQALSAYYQDITKLILSMREHSTQEVQSYVP